MAEPAHNNIAQVASSLIMGEIDTEDAEETLVRDLTREQMASFIIDAINRGWISTFNLGLTEDGELT